MRRPDPTTPHGRLLAARVGAPDPVLVGLREHTAAVVEHVAAGRERAGGVESMLGSLIVSYEIRSMTDWLILTQTRHLDEDGAATHYGLQRTSQLVAATTTISPAAARGTAGLAADLVRLPATDAALAHGRITVEHVRIIRHAQRRLGPLGDTDQDLAAAAEELTAPELGQVVDALIDNYTGAEPDTDEDADGYARRQLHLSARFGGYAIDGFLDQHTGAWLAAALHAHATTTGSSDTRTLAQRHADAVATICRLAAAHPDAPASAKVTITIDTAGHGLTATGAPIGGASLQQATCTAEVTALLAVLFPDGTHTPLDAGANTYRPSPRLRQAVAARDRGCIHHGCDQPPARCHHHHIHHWAHGGKTTLANIVALCAYHHTQAHHGAFTITPHPDKPGHHICLYPEPTRAGP